MQKQPIHLEWAGSAQLKLYDRGCIRMENHLVETNDTLLIYYAATTTGMHAMQQARVGLPSTLNIALASSQHHKYLWNLSAHATFDYRSS
ncbi:MAG: hypothetical protein Q9208_004626 [Pyrenodesmia sp. 3 TL-2023]